MKSTGILAVLVGISLVQCGAGAEADGLDRLNVEEYLKNTKLVEYHIRCLVYDGPCDEIGNQIKQLFAQVGRQCRGCTQQQKVKLGKIIYFWQRNYPKAWQDLMKKTLYSKYAQNQAIEKASQKSNPKQVHAPAPPPPLSH